MKNATIAIVVSLAFHITLATLIALAFVKRDCQNNYESVRLDLSKMDFSLSTVEEIEKLVKGNASGRVER